MTFEHMYKPRYNVQNCNFLETQALAFSKCSLVRATLLLSFDT